MDVSHLLDDLIPRQRQAVSAAVLERWRERPRKPHDDPRTVLIDARGESDAAQLARLLGMRDNRRIYRAE